MKTTKLSAFSVCLCLMAIFLFASNLFAQKGKYEALVGAWDGSADYQGQPFYFTFTFTAVNDTLKGSWAMDIGTFSIKNIEYNKMEDSENYSLTGSIDMDFDGQIISLYLSGTVEKENMTGSFASDMGNSPYTAAKRKSNKEDKLFRLFY